MFRNLRKFSAFAAEDIPVMSKGILSWPDAIMIGSGVIVVTQAMLALQLKLHRVGTDKRFDELEKKLDSLDNELEKKLDSLDKKVESLDKKVDSLDERMELLDKMMNTLTTQVRSLIGKLDPAVSNTR